MSRYIFLPILFIIFSSISNLAGSAKKDADSFIFSEPSSVNDTLKENQILYNGRVWRNLYYMIKKDQFLFSKDFLPGSVSIGNHTFEGVPLRYDIYSDEIMIPTNHGLILELNKEMVDSFSFDFQDIKWHFVNIQEDSTKGFRGYVNVLYKGKTELCVKYKKEIELLAIEKKYDEFYQLHKIYLIKDKVVYLISGKKEFLSLLGDHKQQLKDYIKKNKLIVSRNKPESFVPVIRFYDSLK
jgi:hypothetical protein